MSVSPYDPQLKAKVRHKLLQEMAGDPRDPGYKAKYERIDSKLPPGAPGYLRFSVNLDQNTSGTYKFPILKNDQGPGAIGTYAEENRLNPPDVFWVNIWRVGIYKMLTGTTNAANVPPVVPLANQSQGILYTNPNPNVFTITGQATALNNLYNGWVSVKINVTTYYDSFPILDFRRVGLSQQGVLGGTGGVAAVFDQWDAPFYGGVPLNESGFALNGQATNSLIVNVPNGINMGYNGNAQGTASTAYATNVDMLVEGFLFQEASQLNKI